MQENNLEIDYATPYNKWIKQIEFVLHTRNIKYNKEMIINLYSSLQQSVNNILRIYGYQPKATVSYRINLQKVLKSRGLKLIIKSNDTLWKYLEHFTDITDYSKCFDIYIDTLDFKDSFNNLSITDRIKKLITNINVLKDPVLHEIVNVLELLNEKR